MIENRCLTFFAANMISVMIASSSTAVLSIYDSLFH